MSLFLSGLARAHASPWVWHDAPAAILRRCARAVRRRCPISSNSKATLASRTLLFTRIVAAIAQYLTAAVVLGGKSLTPQALSAMFTAYLQAEKDLDAARIDVAAKQQARDAAYAPLVLLLPDLRKLLAATYGEESTVYASFGFPVTKKAVKTADVVATAVTKARATRASHKAALEAPAPTPPPVTKA